jgi:serine protease Do
MQTSSFFSQRYRKAVAFAAVLGVLAMAATGYKVYAENSKAREAAWYSQPSTAQLANAPAVATSDPAATNVAKSLSNAFHTAASRVLPSVVTITCTPEAVQTKMDTETPDDNEAESPLNGSPFGDMLKDPQFRKFFKGQPMPGMPHHGSASSGSGVIVDPSGVILTNNHVVAEGGLIKVRLSDGREFKAVKIKTDPKTDLAIVHIEGAGNLPAAKLGNSAPVEVGDWVLALGQPFGLEGTVTAGIVSAKGRGIGITDREDFIQTDAAINPGNSGGPLVDLDGQVIGINTAISSNSGGYQGVGFAIPIDLAKWVGGQLETSGSVHRAYLGVIIQPVTQPLAEQFHVKVHGGVLVTEVQPDSPAGKAGVKTGDIIEQFAGQPVSEPRQLQNIVERSGIGSSQEMKVWRDGKEVDLGIVCKEMPGNLRLAGGHFNSGEHSAGDQKFKQLGIEADNLTPQLTEQLGIKADYGVAITNVRANSPAASAGLAPGMVISEVNRMPVKNVDDLRKALGSRGLDRGVLMLVHSSEGSRFVVIRSEENK